MSGFMGLGNLFGGGGGLYTPTTSEMSGIADSYNALGGVSGTGMDFKTWTNTQGINSSPSTGLGDLSGLQGIGAGLQGLGALAGAFTGMKNYKLAKDSLSFNKDMAQKEYAMAKDAYDKNVARSKSIGEQMRAGGM